MDAGSESAEEAKIIKDTNGNVLHAGDYLALSLIEGAESSDLQLYKMAGTELEEVPALSAIEERLVRPRFSDEGTLVVNSEGEGFALYLLDVTK